MTAESPRAWLRTPTDPDASAEAVRLWRAP